VMIIIIIIINGDEGEGNDGKSRRYE
jgi:hypothetical protein